MSLTHAWLGAVTTFRRQQVVLAPEAGPGRTMGTPHSWHQQVALTQQGKEPVPTDVDALLRQSVRQLFPSLRVPMRRCRWRIVWTAATMVSASRCVGLGAIALIVCLATDAKSTHRAPSACTFALPAGWPCAHG
ncbi:MAG: hypothetical protein R2867_01660 [Caldilineaceae bacterium]